MKKIILASASPRRRELLQKIGLTFEVEPSNYEESKDSGLGPLALAKAQSLAKARLVACHHADALIIAADTFIVFNGQIMGKPHTRDEARMMLRTLTGKSHLVITGFTVIDTGNNKVLSKAVQTRVHMKKLSPHEIESYVKTGEPLDKAGGYAIQGLGATIIEKVEGDFYNVIGLPLSALTESLREFGIDIIENFAKFDSVG